jgi:hypothetical protein
MGGKTYNSDPAGWKAATQKYCGLEATVKDPKTGKQMLMYIGDAFDDKYVLVSIFRFREVHPDPDATLVPRFHRHHDRRLLEHTWQPQRRQEQCDQGGRVAAHRSREHKVCCRWCELADQGGCGTDYSGSDKDADICFTKAK